MTQQESIAVARVVLTLECEAERVGCDSSWQNSFQRRQSLRNTEAERFVREAEEDIRELLEGEE